MNHAFGMIKWVYGPSYLSMMSTFLPITNLYIHPCSLHLSACKTSKKEKSHCMGATLSNDMMGVMSSVKSSSFFASIVNPLTRVESFFLSYLVEN